ncbi:MAG: DegV family protein [Proteocatella sp.]
MKKIAVISDTSCDIPDEIVKKYGIRLMPMQVVYSHRAFKDRIDIDVDYVYDNLEKEIPRSSLPLMSDIMEMLEKLKSEGVTHIIAITLSSTLSGTFNAVRSAFDEYTDIFKVELIDSKLISMATGFSVIEAARMAAETVDFEKSVERAKYVLERSRGYFTVDNIKYLIKGGRISSFEGTIGKILDIKPIIGVDREGKYYAAGKIRGRKKSLQAMMNLALEDLKGKKKIKFASMHGRSLQEAQRQYETLNSLDNVSECDRYIINVGPMMAGHSGPGTVGICVSWED